MNVVVTGGGTIAPIDDVRHVANASSGRFSAMITEACLARGAHVWHIHAPNALLPFARQAVFDLDCTDPAAECERLARLRAAWHAARERLHLLPLVGGTVESYQWALRSVLGDQAIDIAFLAMAVSDFEPVTPFAGKLESPTGDLAIPFRPTFKVIREVRNWAPHVYLVGFKLLSRTTRDELVAAAEAACITNRADLTVANDLQTLRQGKHTIHLVRPGESTETIADGDALAQRLVDRVWTWASERNPSSAAGRPPGRGEGHPNAS